MPQCLGNQSSPQDTSEGSQETRTPRALLYAALLGSKQEAAAAIKLLLAQINNDHANFPSELVFRLHSDQGGEFMISNPDL